MATVDLPLFPLHRVLFPGGHLALRIFEPRYLDLVRDCTRRDTGFGVCLILLGEEAGAPAVPAAFGTLARIVDFYTEPGGLLGIAALGGERFRVARTRMRDNGLVHGDVQFRPESPQQPMPAEFGLLATILERLLARSGGPDAAAEQSRYDDAVWVGYRLAEALPLAAHEHQELLQLDDPLERLQRLMHLLPRFQQA